MLLRRNKVCRVSVQRSFALKICRAYRTVSLNASLVLAGLLPLDLRVREVASLYEIKKGASHPALKDREVERPTPALEAPHPARQTRLTFGKVDEERYMDVSRSFDRRIYTDGSKIDGRVGAALSFWEGETETKAIKLALPAYCTVYQAELLALNRAVCEAEKGGRPQVAILSDSRSALEAVTLDSPHPLAEHSRTVLRKVRLEGREISLFWIKAHAGMRGNERADELAKEAALRLKRRPDYDLCPLSFVKRELRKETLGEWEERYVSGETAGGTKLFFPSAVAAYRIVGKIDITHHTTQFITGHGGFSAYLKRFKCAESSSCACDDDKDETVTHLLCECPIFATDRYDIEQQLGITVAVENLSSIMASRAREEFVNYAIKIVKYANVRNRAKLAI